jgi:ribonuclease Z
MNSHSNNKMNNIDSLQYKHIFWQKQWTIPNTPSWHIFGYSRSAYRTGFYIPELNIMLDAGPQNFNHPDNILVTHSHVDHIALLPFTLLENTCLPEHIHVNIYGPKEATDHINNYIKSMFSVNDLSNRPLNFYTYHGLTGKEIFRTTMNKNDIEVQIFKCDHGVPTISYGLSICKQKLKEEYLKLEGQEIGKLRKSGVEITKEVKVKTLAYVCDTSIKVFDLNPEILEYTTIFIECTFFQDDELEHANERKHIHWQTLKKYVLGYPKTFFVLFHFSQRYKDSEIREFFGKEMEDNKIENMYCWC